MATVETVYIWFTQQDGDKSYKFSTTDSSGDSKFSVEDSPDPYKFVLEPATQYTFVYKTPSVHQIQIKKNDDWTDITSNGVTIEGLFNNNAQIEWRCKVHPINMAGYISVLFNKTYKIRKDDLSGIELNLADLNNIDPAHIDSNNYIRVKKIIMTESIMVGKDFLLEIHADEYDNVNGNDLHYSDTLIFDGRGHDIIFDPGDYGRNGIIQLEFDYDFEYSSGTHPFHDTNNIGKYVIHIKKLKINGNNVSINTKNSILFHNSTEIVNSYDDRTVLARFDEIHMKNILLDKEYTSGFIHKLYGRFEFHNCIFDGTITNKNSSGYIINMDKYWYDTNGIMSSTIMIAKLNNCLSWINSTEDIGGFVDKDDNIGEESGDQAWSKFIFTNCFTNQYFTLKTTKESETPVHDHMDFNKSYTPKEYKQVVFLTEEGSSFTDNFDYDGYINSMNNAHDMGAHKNDKKNNYKKNKPKHIKYKKKDTQTHQHNMPQENTMTIDTVADISDNSYDIIGKPRSANKEERLSSEEKQRNILKILDPNNEKYRIDNETGKIYLKHKKYEMSKYKNEDGIEFIQFDGADLTKDIKDDIVIKITATTPTSVTDPSYVGVALPGFRDYIDRCNIKIHRGNNYKFVFDMTHITSIQLKKPEIDTTNKDYYGNNIMKNTDSNVTLLHFSDYFIIRNDNSNSDDGSIPIVKWEDNMANVIYATLVINKNNGKNIELMIDILPELKRMPKRTVYTNTLDVSGEAHKFEGLDWVKVKVDDEDKNKPLTDIIDFKVGHNINQSMFSLDNSGNLLMKGKPMYMYNDLTHNIKHDESIENDNGVINKEKALKPWDDDITDDTMRYKNTKGHNMKIDIVKIKNGTDKMKNVSGTDALKYTNNKYNFTEDMTSREKIPAFFLGISPDDGLPPLEKKFIDMDISNTVQNREDMEKIREFARSINTANIVGGVAKNAIDFTKLQSTNFKITDDPIVSGYKKRKRRKVICREIFENCHADLKVLDISQADLPFDLDDIMKVDGSTPIYGNNVDKRKIKLLNHKQNNGDLSDVTINISNLNGFYCPNDVSGEKIKIKFKFDNDSENKLYLLESTELENTIKFNIDEVNNDGSIVQNITTDQILADSATYEQNINNKNILITAGSINVATNEEAGSSGDPYITPLNGIRYKLPDIDATYCLFGLDDIVINASVRRATKEMNEEMVQYYIKNHGPLPKNLDLVTGGYFYKHIFFKSGKHNLMINLETKQVVSNDENMEYFQIKKSTIQKETKGLFKNEPMVNVNVQFEHSEYGLISYDIKFYDNPQIRNGIYINNILNTSQAIGLCVSNYKPELMRINGSHKNTYQMLKDKLSEVPYKNRFVVKDIKEGETWITKNLKL
jgi:hypothetical protein